MIAKGLLKIAPDSKTSPSNDLLSVFARRLSKTDECCEPAIVGKEGKYLPVSHPSLKNFNLRCQFNFGMTGKTLLTDGKEKASL